MKHKRTEEDIKAQKRAIKVILLLILIFFIGLVGTIIILR